MVFSNLLVNAIEFQIAISGSISFSGFAPNCRCFEIYLSCYELRKISLKNGNHSKENKKAGRYNVQIVCYITRYTLVQINLNTCKKESIFESFRFILKITKVQAVSEIINC